jgi:diguanylate cyclase (GGDEF)-like protein/PAS domain S-box-containing protein
MPERLKAGAFLGNLRTDRRIVWILGAYLLVVGVIIAYTASAIARERGSALVVNVASRQRALAERYVKDVLLLVNGFQADPADDAEQLRKNASALLHGGDVVAVHGVDEEVVIRPASDDPHVIGKLRQEARLVARLINAGNDLLSIEPSRPEFDERLRELRLVGALVTSVSNDAVGRMTSDTEAAVSRLLLMGIALGILGAVAAVAMGLLMRRAGARRIAQFRSLVHNASDVITVLAVDGRIEYQSPSSLSLVGIAPDRLVGSEFRGLVDPQDLEYFEALVEAVAARPEATLSGALRMRHADGTIRHVDVVVSNLIADQTVRGIVLNARDVTDRRALEAELERRAFSDALTGLPNRGVFRDRLDHALARTARHGGGLAILLLDLDGFKVVNDSLGHDAGDELLVAVGQRVQACSRSSDTVARLGGDEFAILLEDGVTEEAATAIAARLIESLLSPFEIRGREVFVGASVGVALDTDGSVAADEFIRNADTAMYAAKGGGRGRFAVFHPAMHRRTVEFFELQADLQRALVRDEFTVHYQPIVDIATGGILGLEALVRWRHPRRGLIPPLEFIPLAEETGMIVPLGVWVLGEACRQAAEWRANVPGAAAMWVSVNLSTRQLLEPDLVDRVAEILHESGLDPAGLVLEITEGSLLQDVEQTSAKLRALKDLGTRLALDDFGTGASSLGHLRRFPIDVLKIDKTFVDDVAGPGSEGSALVQAIVDLAHSLELATVAEGIEQDEQLSGLRAVGCSSAQGFLFARPLPSDEVEAVLRDGAVAPIGEGSARRA